MKKLLSMFLAVTLITSISAMFGVGVSAGSVSQQTQIEIEDDATVITVDEVEYVVIRTAEQFDAISFDEQNSGLNYILAKDLDMGGADFTYIAGLRSNLFDGNGYSIYNFSLNAGENASHSVFAIYTRSVAEHREESIIRNVNIGTPEIPVISRATGDSGNAGITLGTLLSGTNCVFVFENINVYVDYDVTGVRHVGGLIGNSKGRGVIKNCNVYGTITSDPGNGGGNTAGFIGSPSAGMDLTIENCANYATINGKSSHKLAGFIGENSSYMLRLINCINYADITSTGSEAMGGIVARHYAEAQESASSVYLIEKCINYGKIQGTNKTGGILAHITSNANGKKDVDFKITECINYGDIVGSGGDAGACSATIDSGWNNVRIDKFMNFGNMYGGGNNKAGIAGSITVRNNIPLYITNSINFGNITSNSRVAAATGYLSGAVSLDRFVNLGNLQGKHSSAGAFVAETTSNLSVIKNSFSYGDINNGDQPLGQLRGGNIGTAITYENNYYKKAVSDKAINTDGCDKATELASITQALEILNANYSDIAGKFIAGTDENKIVLASPKFSAVQMSKTENNMFNIRLVATLKDSLAYSEVGFRVKKTAEGEINTIKCNHVYIKLKTNKAGQEATAASLGGTYIFALTVDDISATGNIKLFVTAYAIGIDTAEYTSAEYTVEFQDGIFVGAYLTPQA